LHERKVVNAQSEILTVKEVARELKCSVAQVGNVINGKVRNVSPLPAIPIGRRKLVRREALEEWIRANEKGASDAMISAPKADAARREEDVTDAKRVSERELESI
jgi:Helix-turn-helix domain